MGNFVSFRTAFILPILLVICHYIATYLLFLDLNKRVYNHAPGTCSQVAGIEHGAEDVEIIDETCVIISTGCKKFPNEELENTTGRIYVYNISARSAWELKLSSKNLRYSNFYPHGISFWKEKSQSRLFVVNHRIKRETVEVFIYDHAKKQLNHSKTVKSPLFNALESVVALSKETFYAINSHFFRKNFGRGLEMFLALPFGNIVHFDGKKSRVIQNWLATPSGIALDVSKKWLYVSLLTKSCIVIYRIEQDYNLTQHSIINLASAPDNIFVDRFTADLYVATHAVKMRKFRHEFHPKTSYSPSQVLKIHGRPSKGNWSIVELYANDGATISSASVAVRIKDKLIIGSTFDKMIACDIDFLP